MNRRQFLAGTSLAMAQAGAGGAGDNIIVVDPAPLFDISPYLYMQFLQNIGLADGSPDCYWDFDRDDWRQDFVDITRDLSPGMLRYSGTNIRYYKWREGVGPFKQRPLVRNYLWGGMDDNRIGTHEYIQLCRKTAAEPLIGINFLSDGVQKYRDENRSGDAREAADWVSYCNDPDNSERKKNGSMEPLTVKLWQLGNETSYGRQVFNLEECITHTIEFAKAMRERDPSIKLAGWGDRDVTGKYWGRELLERAGDQLDYICMHMMAQHPIRRDTVLNDLSYRLHPDEAWDELIELANQAEKRLLEFEQAVDVPGSKAKIAITEGHLSLKPWNINPILCEWISAVYPAKTLNLYQRHGAKVKIATAADYAGTRWNVNAVRIPVSLELNKARCYFTPAGSIAHLFNKHNGKQATAVKATPQDLDIVASRTGDRLFLHVLNVSFRKSVQAEFAVQGMRVKSGRVFQIAPEDPGTAVTEVASDVFAPKEATIEPGPTPVWSFPARSVAAVELAVEPA